MQIPFENTFIDTEAEALKVFIADDHAPIRQWLKSVIANFPKIALVGEAESTLTTLRGLRTTQPELVILDISMPGRGGLHILSKIKSQVPPPIVIVFTGKPKERYQPLCLSLGADFYVAKTEEFHQIETLLDQCQKAKQAWLSKSDADFKND